MADKPTQKTYENEKLGVKFSIPLAVSDLKFMQYMGYVRQSQKSPATEYISLWKGAQLLIDSWECEIIPDLWKDDLNSTEPGGMARTFIRNYTGNRIHEHIAAVLAAEKKE